MKIYLVGAPSTDKTKLASAVQAAAPYLKLFVTPDDPDGPALGAQADYRTEMVLAVDRMRASMDSNDWIFTGSLIDSVAHTAVNFTARSSYLNADETALHLMTSHVIAAMLRDSFKHDYVFFLPGHSDEFGEEIEIGLQAVLDTFGLSYVELGTDFDENVKLISNLALNQDVSTQDE